MDEQAREVVSRYIQDKLSESQISDLLSLHPKLVRRIIRRENVKKRSISEAIRYSHITRFDAKQFTPKANLSHRDELLKVAGVMLYWGEGTKSRGTVALSNSNPMIIKIFLKFLRNICGIDNSRLHATIHYYEDQDLSTLLNFWSEKTLIPPIQFYKPYLHIKGKGSYKKTSSHGTISFQYSDVILFNLITSWMNEYSKI